MARMLSGTAIASFSYLLSAAFAQVAPDQGIPMPEWFNCTGASATELEVSFPSPVGAINCGTRLYKCPESPTQTEPTITLASADAEAGYAVMMIDGSNSARHFLMGTVPGYALAQGFSSENKTGTILQPYHGPHPPSPGTPGRTDYIHDYGQFVFKQPSPVLTFDPVNTSSHHGPWCRGCPPENYVAFIQRYKLGNKVASNYLLCSS